MSFFKVRLQIAADMHKVGWIGMSVTVIFCLHATSA